MNAVTEPRPGNRAEPRPDQRGEPIGAALTARDVRKSFGRTQVLRGVDLTLQRGRVDGLIGRNGAGKSTLVNILTGRLDADRASITVGGVPRVMRAPSDALDAGIVAVPQELVMPMDMTVGEVVVFGAEPGRFGVLDLGRARREVRELLRSLRLDVDIRTRVRDLPVSWQRVVMVAQALYRRAGVIILDEPTAAMNAEDCMRVLDVVHDLKDRGVAVLYISHRFDEVESVCDRVTAMADGQVIEVLEGDALTHSRLVGAIAGTEPLATTARRGERAPNPDEPLVFTQVHTARLNALSLGVARGEIVGVAGLPGSGVEDVFQVMSGRLRPDAGGVTIGTDSIASPRQARRGGIALLPARRADAALAGEPVLENLALPALSALSTAGLLTRGSLRARVASVVERLSLVAVSGRQMWQLSGGNQQRVLVGAKLLAQPRFLLLEDPTVGVDVAARAELHRLLWDLADQGMGLLVGSSDPEELLGLCDRVVAIRRGRVAREWGAGQASEHDLLEAITGGEIGDGADPAKRKGKE